MAAPVARGGVDLGPGHLAQLVKCIGERRFFFLSAVRKREVAPKIAQGEERRLILGRPGSIRLDLKPLT